MNLIFTVAFGNDHFFRLAQEMTNALRLRGYAGEIRILTDRDWAFTGAINTVMEMNPKQLWKAGIARAVNCKDYEKILFIDSDIAFIQPCDEVFSLDGIRFPLEPLTIGASGLNSIFLTQEEKQGYGGLNGYNAGTFLMPGDRAEEFLSAFESGWLKYAWGDLPDYWPGNGKYKPQMSDQSALQAMAIRGELAVLPFPDGMISFPGIKHIKNLDSVFALHFAGPQHTEENKAQILAWMKGCEADPLKVCESVASVSYKWNGGKSQLESLTASITSLSKAIFGMLAKYDAMEKRLTDLEHQKEFA